MATFLIVLSAVCGAAGLWYWRKRKANRLAGIPKRLWRRGNYYNSLELLERPTAGKERFYRVLRTYELKCPRCYRSVTRQFGWEIPFEEGVDPIFQLQEQIKPVNFPCSVCPHMMKLNPNITPSEWRA